ncbi:MAG: hypothetical protein NT000_02150 [Proteobacteria bacterium]|nr:hypothetical protein [Pseudomonadota bacterium]
MINEKLKLGITKEGRRSFFLWSALISIYLFEMLFIFKPFSAHYLSVGDSMVYPVAEDFFYKSLHLFPFPHLSLYTNDILYPFGLDFIAHGWSLERHYFTAILTRLLGSGPWLAWYGCFSFSVATFGTLFLVRSRWGTYRGILAAILIGLFNLSALTKYPDHMNLSFVHWAALSILTDVLICSDLAKKKISFSLLSFRAFLLVAGVGLDVSIIAGFGLTSFAVMLGCGGYYGFIKIRGRTKKQGVGFWSLSAVKAEFSQYQCTICRFWVFFWALLTVSCIWAFVPILATVVMKYRGLFSDLTNEGSWWANPLRLMVPWLPIINPNTQWLKYLFLDRPEMPGNMSPGWTLSIPGLLAIWVVYKNKLKAFYPLIILFFILAGTQPDIFPIIKLFPWMRAVRVSGRFSLVFPAIFIGLLLVPEITELVLLQLQRWQPNSNRKGLLVLWALLFIAEGTYFFYQRPKLEKLSTDQAQFFETIKNSQGEALLEWPFCISSGNGVGTGQFCASLEQSGVSGFSHFHQKKITSFYLGRLLEAQIAPFFLQGWQHLHAVNRTAPNGDIFIKKQAKFSRCFNKNEWAFFLDVFQTGPFSGVQLYTKYLPLECIEEFQRKMGPIEARTSLPGVGEVVFIKKPEGDRKNENRDRFLSLKFIPEPKKDPVYLGTHDLITYQGTSGVRLSGISPVIKRPGFSTGFRRLERPVSTIVIKGPRAASTLKVILALRSAIPGQEVSLNWNGKKIITAKIFSDPKEFVFLSHDLAAENRLTLQANNPPSLEAFLKTLWTQEGIKMFLRPITIYHLWNTAGDRAFSAITKLEIQAD